MERDLILKRAEEILADLPTTPIHPASRQLLSENPIDWFVSRRRSLRTALQNGDGETLNSIVNDVAHVVGNYRAELWKIDEMWKMIKQEQTS